MRDTFRAYYPPSPQELSQMWTDATIVLDTNVLLNFFRYTPDTRDSFLAVLEKLRTQLWLPYQVGLEFHERRLEVIYKNSQAFTNIVKELEKARKSIATAADAYKNHPSLNRSELVEKVDTFVKNLTSEIEEKERQHERSTFENGSADATFERITKLFKGNVGQPFTKEEINEIESEGAQRYENEVPPGYKDGGKDENRYGDLIIWKEVLRRAKEGKRPTIFITDDRKEDWWRRVAGKTQGPRVELLNEYWATAQQRIHFYEPMQFLKQAEGYTASQVSAEALDEVKAVSRIKSQERRMLHRRRRELQMRQRELQERLEEAMKETRDSRHTDMLELEARTLEDEYARLQSMRKSSETELEVIERLLAKEPADEISEDRLQDALRTHREESAHLEARIQSLEERRRMLRNRMLHSGRFSVKDRDLLMRDYNRIEREIQMIEDTINSIDE